MNNRITQEDIFNFFKNCGREIGCLALEIYGESLNYEAECAFADAIEIGVVNTIAALYDANVEDDEIIRVVCEHWGIQKVEAEERLLIEKPNAAIRSLKHYLKMQGYTSEQIYKFMINNNAYAKIRNTKELWYLKDLPKKLIKEIDKTKC